MTIDPPQYADPFATDPELLAWLRDTLQDAERTQGETRFMHLSRLEWFIRERIARGIAEGIEGAHAPSSQE